MKSNKTKLTKQSRWAASDMQVFLDYFLQSAAVSPAYNSAKVTQSDTAVPSAKTHDAKKSWSKSAITGHQYAVTVYAKDDVVVTCGVTNNICNAFGCHSLPAMKKDLDIGSDTKDRKKTIMPLALAVGRRRHWVLLVVENGKVKIIDPKRPFLWFGRITNKQLEPIKQAFGVKDIEVTYTGRQGLFDNTHCGIFTAQLMQEEINNQPHTRYCSTLWNNVPCDIPSPSHIPTV